MYYVIVQIMQSRIKGGGGKGCCSTWDRSFGAHNWWEWKTVVVL